MNKLWIVIAAVLALVCVTASAEDAAAAAAPKQLDLRPPDLRDLYSEREIERLIAKMEAKHIEEVEVEGARVPPPEFTPRVWPAIAAPFWALLHPTQAWRIFAPLPPDQTRDMGPPPPFTEGYLEPLGVPPGDPFKQ